MRTLISWTRDTTDAGLCYQYSTIRGDKRFSFAYFVPPLQPRRFTAADLRAYRRALRACVREHVIKKEFH